MSLRMEKIDNLIHREIGTVLGQIKDKYLGLITVTKVETSRDLSISKIWVSSLSVELDDKKLNQVLKHYMRDILAHMKNRVTLKKMPHLLFKIDRSGSKVQRVEEILGNLFPES